MRLLNFLGFIPAGLENPDVETTSKARGNFIYFNELPLLGSEYMASKLNYVFPCLGFVD